MIETGSKSGWARHWPRQQGATLQGATPQGGTSQGVVPGLAGFRKLAVFAFALFAAAASAQELEPSQIDVSELGPQVGELVPEFSLPDQTGEIRTRESIMGPRGAMLVFVRSADW